MVNESELKKTYLWQISEKVIAENSVSHLSNASLAGLVGDELSSLGFRVELTDEGNNKKQVVAWIGPPEENGIILSGHLDIVPFENQIGWTKEPLKLTLEDEKLYGRGTTDMKLFIPHCLQAFKNVDLSKLKAPVVCVFTCDEEVGCLGAKSVSPKLKNMLGEIPLPKSCVIGEPTGFEIIHAHRGMVIFEIQIKGQGGHSSRPDWGVNAILPTEKVINAVNELNEEYRTSVTQEAEKLFPDYPFNFLTLVKIDGGKAMNMIPDECVLSFSYRAIPGDDLYMLYNDLQKKLKDLPNLEFKKLISVPFLAPKKDVRTIEALKEITGNDTLRAASFATDASYLTTADIACYICGPGTTEKAHQPDEYMTLDHFLRGPTYVESLLKRLVF